MIWIAPLVFFPVFIAPVLYALGRKNARVLDKAAVCVTGISLILSVGLFLSVISGAEINFQVKYILINGLSFQADGFRVTYSLIASFMWFFTALFSGEYFRHEREYLNSYYAFYLITLGATQGVMLSADFMTAFIFFEILSFSSFTWVVHERAKQAIHAGYVYLFIAVTGGLILLTGLLLLYHESGTLDFISLRDGILLIPDARRIYFTAAAICILLGFGAKAGMYPLHIWLPMAHPVAPSPASALLSGILTKVGVFGILMLALSFAARDFAIGFLILILALITMTLGAVLAIFSTNLKRTLACSSMSQIGFILTGVACRILCGAYGAKIGVSGGINGAGSVKISEITELTREGAELALSGTVTHMLNHSLLKLLLFMAAGAIVMNLHELDLNILRGWGRGQYALKFAFLIGLLGISGVPGFHGYLSKSMLHEGLSVLIEAAELVENNNYIILLLRASEWVFLISGGCTFAYMLKIFICIFISKNPDIKLQARYDSMPSCMRETPSQIAVIGSAAVCVPLGIPAIMIFISNFMTGQESLKFSAFSWETLQGALISLFIGLLIYIFPIRMILLTPSNRSRNLWPDILNLEKYIYTPMLTKWLPGLFGNLAAIFAENAILKPVCARMIFAASIAGRALDQSTDALIMFLRRTVAREVKPRDGRIRVGAPRRVQRATSEALRPLMESFSFVLLMTCLGIILILGVLTVLLRLY